MAAISLRCPFWGGGDWRGGIDGRRRPNGKRSEFDLLLRKTDQFTGRAVRAERSGITSWENWCRFVRLANSNSTALMKNARSLQFSLPSNFRLVIRAQNLFLVVQKEVSDDTSTKRVEVRLSGLCHTLDGRSTGRRGLCHHTWRVESLMF